jgi:hypothetical protein
LITRHPHFDRDAHGCATDSLNARVTGNAVTDADWM